MDTDTSDRVIAIFSEVLQLPADQLGDHTSPETTAKWDSLAALNLVLALEEEFGVKLSAREIVTMRSIAAAKQVLRTKGVGGV
jgi:acyl carrier protein